MKIASEYLEKGSSYSLILASIRSTLLVVYFFVLVLSVWSSIFPDKVTVFP